MWRSSHRLDAWLLCALALFGSCRSQGVETRASTEVLAECPVCKHEGDLACVSVRVSADTPSCRCDGETFYFCSDECAADFQAQPERYRTR